MRQLGIEVESVLLVPRLFFSILAQLLSHRPSRNCSSSVFLGPFVHFSVRFSSSTDLPFTSLFRSEAKWNS
jgi:hypothetical protein